MKEMALADIQHVSLGILKDIHAFCEENGICYSVAGGSLIGAVRHKGIIPWDDDIDIMMPRMDYERFCRTYSSSSFRLLWNGNDKTCMIAFARVCDFSSSIVKGASWTGQPTGIWVDIFPMDGAEDEREAFNSRCGKIYTLWMDLFRTRSIQRGESPEYTSAMRFFCRFVRLLRLGWFNRYIAARKVRRISGIASSVPFGSTGHCSQMVMLMNGSKEYFSIEDFYSTITLPFEDMSVRAISGYDGYLRTLYGNYMQLPPESERVPKQSYLKFFWR